MDKNDKVRLVGFSMIISGLIIATVVLNPNNTNKFVFYFGLKVAFIGGIINTIGYHFEKKAFNKEQRKRNSPQLISIHLNFF